MSCDPPTLLAASNCILDCLTPGQMEAINSKLICDIANTTGNFVLKTGDTMTGNLLVTSTGSIQTGLLASADIMTVLGVPIVSFFGSSGTCEIFCKYSNDSNGPSYLYFHTRSAVDTTADVILVAGDSVLQLTGHGSDGADYRECARIRFKLDSAAVPGLNDMPGFIDFQTTPDGLGTMLVRASINSTGFLDSAGSFINTNSTPIPVGGTAGVGYMFSSTANFGMFFGSGIPALSAAQGSWYSRSDGSGTTDRAYINTDGAVGWTAVTTVA